MNAKNRSTENTASQGQFRNQRVEIILNAQINYVTYPKLSSKQISNCQ